ncbi:transglycosylase domain-containing protein [Ferrovum myxofaciens]|nr:transglycosylase domain-containing protein [Ferrovum myxofaciens]MBU6993705.1 transglycosylase domain-containing protein [Ferrovum myxofaciens]QKE37595.2 MAG: transglycosylase domain-containing protein [Ferrovum myxofaciens]QWY75254.1 MAG: transglycosylase domain-containing protein [Ferrovum myxofaciens]QWY77993.1 MAG: transglycosylase domain-containing protein [Ferrovum myxofaciens]
MSGWIVINELRSSWLQAHYFFRLASRLDYKLEKGPSPSIRFPKSGPYDERLGYGQIPEYTKSLTTRGFVVTEQVRMSPALLESPLAPIYAEKDQAGLMLLDHNQRLLYALLSPTRTYVSFDSIPKILIDTLLFIEDKELLNSHYPMRNPAVNWSRLDRALFDQALHVIHRQHDTPGASTLATQIEKYRHSPEGRTLSIHEKFLQMDSASIRSYLQGMDNMANRHQIVLAYLNTVPLTARMGYGEVNGLGDGMWMWYGRDFQEVNHLLQLHGDESLQQRAEAYKQALSLIIAQRRPSYFLREGSPVLMQMTNHYLKLLGSAHIISPALQRAALSLPLHLNHGPLIPQANSFVSHKAVNLLRNDLLSLLHITNLYALDRIDLNVKTTLDGDAQRAVTNLLRQVQSPAGARAAGLYGHNMLGENDNPQRLSFSFTLFERSSNSNLLRVQTDDLDQPFDINSGARLNLGSTSKLRTLITYLEIMTRLHQSYADMNQKDLQKIQAGSQDTLTRWALTYFVENPHSRLQDMLEAAMTRTYSGNPAEAFFTGGGLQKFKNFEPEKDDGIMTVREGFQHSVNLVFVRLMRDIVHHYEAQTLSVGVVGLVKTTPSNYNPITGSTTGTAEVSVNPSQQIQLSLFADREGREFLFRFYKKYKGKSPDEMLQTLVDGIHAKPKNLALIFRSVEPEASFLQFTAFMHHQLPEAELDEKSLQILYDKFAVEKYSLMDRGYLAGIHPLELWLVGYLFHHPKATLTQLVETSAQQRQEVYQWLFKSHNKKVQESRIRQMLELEAFQMIAADWRRLGYPFESLTPSYATALGASGDRPDSLAKLMGIVVNKGLLMPMVELQELQFAKGTPYETHFVSQPAAGVRMLPVEVTEVVRRSLIDVVQGGTGIRLKDGLVQKNGQVIEIGGKTGTGDQRFVSYAPNGKLIASRAVNRSATFVFLIGDRFFGTVTAYVHEPYAADYKFTSAMTVQLLKSLLPVLGMPAS